ncbi:MAG: hypothetical protein NT069_05900 [Planctomycetota bacterium]|nr:hypothetical protein [Planctomycetota bacterium]
MPPLLSPNVLLLGNSADPEFDPVVTFLRGSVPHARIQEAADLPAARHGRPVGAPLPDVVVVCQSWSDQFSSAEIRELLAWLPLARIICCYGAWCDSDGRTREHWPLAVRVAAVDGPNLLSAELAEFQRAKASSARSPVKIHRADDPVPAQRPLLPWTASRTEIYQSRFPVSAMSNRPIEGLRIGVLSPDRAWRQMMERFLMTSGGVISHVGEDHSGDTHQTTLLYDADPADPPQIAELIDLKTRSHDLFVVAAIGFPRVDLDERLRRAGADATWAKLSPLTQLIERLQPHYHPQPGR